MEWNSTPGFNWTANRTLRSNVTYTTESPEVVTAYGVAKYIEAIIIIVGLVTNSLIVIILSRRRIGSQTTRIILMFLGVTDVLVLVVNLLIHFIPTYYPRVPIFYTDLGCGIGTFVQPAVITASSWYLVLMTVERSLVVWFPMKAKIFCTQKKVIIACIVIPIISLLCYCHLVADMGVVEVPPTNHKVCRPKDTVDGSTFKMKVQAWIVLYFFIPAILIVLLNTGIVVRLSQAGKLQKTIRTRSRVIQRQGSSWSAAENSIRKATTLVMVASVTFVVLMIPRGVLTTLTFDHTWDYESPAMEIADLAVYLLQYSNHAINFFLYILANQGFRNEIFNMMRCRGRRPTQYHRRVPLETDTTQNTFKHSKKLLCCRHVDDIKLSSHPLTERRHCDDHDDNDIVTVRDAVTHDDNTDMLLRDTGHEHIHS